MTTLAFIVYGILVVGIVLLAKAYWKAQRLATEYHNQNMKLREKNMNLEAKSVKRVSPTVNKSDIYQMRKVDLIALYETHILQGDKLKEDKTRPELIRVLLKVLF